MNAKMPLPYKGMNTRAEIASRIFPAIFAEQIKIWGDLHNEDNHKDVAMKTLLYTEALIKELAKYDEKENVKNL